MGRLTDMRSRAEKWIAGLTAIVAVLATATVVEGPDSFSKIPEHQRYLVLALIMVGAGGIALGLICAYTAAFGGLVTRSKVDTLIEETRAVTSQTAQQVDDAVDADTKAARRFLSFALVLTVLGAVALAGATALSWTVKPSTEDSVCLLIGGEEVELESAPVVKSGTVQFGCP